MKALPKWFCLQFVCDAVRGIAPKPVADKPAAQDQLLYEARPPLRYYRNGNLVARVRIPALGR